MPISVLERTHHGLVRLAESGMFLAVITASHFAYLFVSLPPRKPRLYTHLIYLLILQSFVAVYYRGTT